MTNQVKISVEDGVLSLSFNRPEKKNALTLDMYKAATAAIERAESDPAIRVVLFTGEGDMFTAGNDIGDFLSVPPDAVDSPVVLFLQKLAATDIPLLAAVNGRAVGIGTTLLMHCEKVFADEQAVFTTPFVNLAVVPEAASSLLMPRSLGYQQAARMLVFGESLAAQAALACGLVSEVVAASELRRHALNDARRIAQLPKRAMRNAKRLMRRPDEAIADRIGIEMKDFGEALNSPESQEAMSAFMEKRAPDFSQFS